MSINVLALLMGTKSGQPVGDDVASFLIGKAIGAPPTPPQPAGKTVINMTGYSPDPSYPYLYLYCYIGYNSIRNFNYYYNGEKYRQNNKALYIPLTGAESQNIDFEFENTTTSSAFPPSLAIIESSQPIDLVESSTIPGTSKKHTVHYVENIYNAADELLQRYEAYSVTDIMYSTTYKYPQEKCHITLDLDM